MQLPVLLLAYNRAHLVADQLPILLKNPRVGTIYIAVDGPKKNVLDQQKVTDVHQVIFQYQQRSRHQIKTLLSPTNQGCQKGVEAGINWFFTHEAAGIILEDDCHPHPSFFPYCAELLTRYQDDQRVGMISGTNPLTSLPLTDSYFFSHQSIVWGWASWRRAWKDYQRIKKQGSKLLAQPAVRAALLSLTSKRHLAVIDKVFAGQIDTWDYIWYVTNILAGRFCILPSQNLISNVGFTADATHTKIKTTQAGLKQHALKFPLQHPTALIANAQFEKGYLQQTNPWNLAQSIIRAYAGW